MVHGTHTLPVRETSGNFKMDAILAQSLLEVLGTEMEKVEEEETGQAKVSLAEETDTMEVEATEGQLAAEEEVMEEMEI